MVLGIINTSNQSQLSQFVAENSLTFPILYDPGSPGGVQGGDTYDQYYLPNDGSPYPRDFIINQDGIIEYANNEIDTDWMISIINDLMGNSNLMLGDINFDGVYRGIIKYLGYCRVFFYRRTGNICYKTSFREI